MSEGAQKEDIERRLAELEARQGDDERRDRRRVFWQASGAVLALITTAFLVWQTVLFRGQLAVQSDQLRLQADQLKLQSEQLHAEDEEAYQNRLTTLLGILYDRRQTCGDGERRCPPGRVGCPASEMVCPLAADVRTREEAVRTYLALLRGHHVKAPNLSHADLSGMDLRAFDFGGVNLEVSDFSRSNLAGARFDDAVLSLARFARARVCLQGVGASPHFKNASGYSTDFTGAYLCPDALADSVLMSPRCPDGSDAGTARCEKRWSTIPPEADACAAMFAANDRYMECPQVSPYEREQMRQRMADQKEHFVAMPDDSPKKHQLMQDTCRIVLASLQQSAEIVGCMLEVRPASEPPAPLRAATPAAR